MPLKIDKLIATEVFVDGNEVTGKEGTLTNIWIPLELGSTQSGGFNNLNGSEEDLFYGLGRTNQLDPLDNSHTVQGNSPSFYEDNNGLIHIGIATNFPAVA